MIPPKIEIDTKMDRNITYNPAFSIKKYIISNKHVPQLPEEIYFVKKVRFFSTTMET